MTKMKKNEVSDITYYYIDAVENISFTNVVKVIDALNAVGNLYETAEAAEFEVARRDAMRYIQYVYLESWKESWLNREESPWNGISYTLGIDQGELIAVECQDNFRTIGELRFPNKDAIALIIQEVDNDTLFDLCYNV